MKRIIIFLICFFTFVLCWSKNNVYILTQSIVNKKRGTFIIDRHYNIDGKTIVFPKGLVIKFRKGKIDNGIIVGTNTKIQIDKNVCAFGKNIKIQGRWDVKEVYDKWFEFDSNPNFVANSIIRNILALSNDETYCHIILNEPRTYYYQLEYKGRPDIWNILSYRTVNGKKVRFWDEIHEEKFSALRIFTIPSNTRLTVNNTLKMLPTKAGAYFVFWEYDKGNITVDGKGSIYGDCRCHQYFFNKEGKYSYSGEWGTIFRCFKCRNFLFKDITLSDAHGDAIAYDGSRYPIESGDRKATNLMVENVKVKYARRNGISVCATNVRIINCYFEGCGIDEIYGTAPKAAVDFETDNVRLYPENVNVNVLMSNCIFKNNKYDVSSTNNNLPNYGRIATTIKNCKFTAPVRLNPTYWIKFENCTIPGFTNWINSITDKTPVKYLQFNHCIIDSMPAVYKTESWHNSFIKCNIKRCVTN